MSASATSSAATGARTARLLLAVRAGSALTVLMLAWQFVSAGQLFGSSDVALTLHGAGAITLHVVSGLTAIFTGLLWRAGGAPVWPVVVAVAVFGYSFLQAANGGYQSLWVHVPGAMALVVGAVWLLVWALRTRTTPTRAT